MGYRVGNNNYSRIHPTLNENVFYYYSFEDGLVHVSALNLNDFTIYFEETIYGASMN